MYEHVVSVLDSCSIYINSLRYTNKCSPAKFILVAQKKFIPFAFCNKKKVSVKMMKTVIALYGCKWK